MSPCSDFLPLQGRSQDFFRGTHMQLTKYPFHLMVVHGKEMYQKSVLQMQNLLFNFLNLLLFDVALVVIAATKCYRCVFELLAIRILFKYERLRL